jgi:hypothetical protein
MVDVWLSCQYFKMKIYIPCLKLDWAAIAIIDDMMSNKSSAKTATDDFNLEKGAIIDWLFLTKSIYVVC